jgi:hypothetical protein
MTHLLRRISSQCFIVTSFASKQGINPLIPPSRNVVLIIVMLCLQMTAELDKSGSRNSKSVLSYKITLIQVVANYRTLFIPLSWQSKKSLAGCEEILPRRLWLT